MGYKAEKDRIEKRIKLFKRILLSVLFLILLAVCIFSFILPPNTWKYYVALPSVEKRVDGEMRIHFLSVGQGDCTLIELPDGKVMLIDGGDGSEYATKRIIRYCKALKISNIDYLVVTHADSDHCGGLAEIMQQVSVKNAYLPPVEGDIDTEYATFYSALIKTDAKRVYSSRLIENIGGKEGETEYPYTLSFLSPRSYTVENIVSGTQEVQDDNLLSAVVWLDYQGTSTLFMGDAPAEVEEILLRDFELEAFHEKVDLLSTEILKISHHGSGSATSTQFLQKLGVKEGIISCGEGNAYGHPDLDTLGRLEVAGVNISRTDLHGDVRVTVSKTGAYTIKRIPAKG